VTTEFDVGRDDVENVAMDQAIALEASQGLRQHLGRDSPDGTLEFAGSQRPGCQQVKNGDSPLGAKQLDGVTGLQGACSHGLKFGHRIPLLMASLLSRAEKLT
jgi:hypothetical protein